MSSTYSLGVARKRRNIKRVATAEDFAQLIASTLSERWGAIIERAAQDAEAGDATARAWLSDRQLGKPLQTNVISGTIEHNYSGQVNIAALVADATKRLKDNKTQ